MAQCHIGVLEKNKPNLSTRLGIETLPDYRFIEGGVAYKRQASQGLGYTDPLYLALAEGNFPQCVMPSAVRL